MSSLPVVPSTTATAAAKPDFVMVRLTEAGRAFAGDGGKLRVANAHMSYTFEGTTAQRVVYRGDWTTVLSMEKAYGKPLFEIAPDATTTAAPATNAAAAAAPASTT